MPAMMEIKTTDLRAFKLTEANITDKGGREMCKELNPSDISNERVGIELKKTLEQAKTPSKFFYSL